MNCLLCRRSVVLAVAVPVILGGTAASSAYAQVQTKKPNIIFILADDLGYGDLGCYGQEKIKTPNLDKLAAQGLRFTQAYAGSTVCAPSRCALMTGLHTGHCRIRGNANVPLEQQDTVVGVLLKALGYITGLIGKWGLGEADSSGAPNKQGFDYFFGFVNQGHAHNYYPDFLWRNTDKVPIPANVQLKKNVAAKKVVYAHDLFTEEALQFIEKNKAGPFFLYLAYTIPHANNEAGKIEGMEVPSDEPYSKEPWPQPQKNHAAMITRMDRDIGRLMDRLRDLGLEDNTIVFFSSDNGPHQEGGGNPFFFRSSGPLRGFKRSLHEGGVRVPLIVRWPGKLPAGKTTDQIFAFWDFLPTVLELAGGKAPDKIDGISIAPTLLGQGQQKQHDFLYWEFHEGGFQQAIRMGDWKAVREKQGGPLELYDLSKDVGEAQNIAAANADVVQRLEKLLAGARIDSPHWPVKSPKAPKK
jgi:arylsulfatase A-like enzyme